MSRVLGLMHLGAAALALGFLSGPGVVAAGEIPVKSAKASSVLPEAQGVSYAAANAADQRVGTFWVEGEESAGLGEWIQFDFGKMVTITHVEVRPGNWYSQDFWQRHNRIKEAQFKFRSGAPVRHTFEDKKEVQVVKFKTPVKTPFVKLILKGVYEGTTFNDTCLSEVRFFGPDGPIDMKTLKGATASSTYDGYNAVDVADGMLDTYWCEKVDGSGQGEWLELDYGVEQKITGLKILNGSAATSSAYMRNNRASSVKIEVGGTQITAELKDDFGAYQTVKLPQTIAASKVKLGIVDVKKGTEYDDTCLAEVQLLTE